MKLLRILDNILRDRRTLRCVFAAAVLSADSYTGHAAFDWGGTNIICDYVDPYCRRLKPEERALAEGIFAEQIDYDRVKIVYSPVFTGFIRAIGRDFTAGAIGSTFHASSAEEWRKNYSKNDVEHQQRKRRNGFQHEMTHIYQWQKAGAWSSLLLGAKITLTQSWRRSEMYKLEKSDAAKNWSEFNIEQQGELVGKYQDWRDYLFELRTDPEFPKNFQEIYKICTGIIKNGERILAPVLNGRTAPECVGFTDPFIDMRAAGLPKPRPAQAPPRL